MGKAKTTSKVKLSNKSTNKRMNATRRHKLNKSVNKSKVVNIPTTTTTTKKQMKQVTPKPSVDVYDDVYSDNEDTAFSDEEMADFINNSVTNLSFLSADYTIKSNDRKRKSKEEVPEYEKMPRSLPTVNNVDKESTKTVHLLPIKGDKGLIARTGEREVNNENIEPTPVSDQTTNESDEVEESEPLSLVELLAQRKLDINNKKLQIAQSAQDVVENPETNINLLRRLLFLCNKCEATSIRKLSMLSLLEIFKDIIPSYRIRELSAEEKAAKVSKDIRKVRDFEESLLGNYQKYLQLLEECINDYNKLLKKKLKNGSVTSFEVSLKALKGMALVAVKCLTQLLQNAAHFNYRGNIITVVVPGIEMTGDMQEAAKLCSDGIHSLFRDDNTGEISLEIIKVIHRLVKSKPNVKPAVLETLLSLRINTEAIQAAAMKGNKIERLKEKREAIKKLSKKEKKRKKIEDELSKELQEAEAVESSSKIERLQTEILKLLFVTYFRVLKTPSSTPLLKPVLKGLSKFAHVINVEFFDDLMTCLQHLLQTEILGVDEKLSCIVTALKILSGQGEALNIDPRQFYTELYNILPFISSNFSSSDGELLRRCLDMMLLKRRKQVSVPQVLAFFKRISTLLLQTNTEQMFDYIMLIRNILQLHKKCDYLLDNEDFGRGIYQQDTIDPEHSNAEGTSSWEFLLLWKHYHPHTVTYVKHVLNGAPSQGSGALPTKFLQRYDGKRLNDDSLDEFFLDEILAKPKKIAKTHHEETKTDLCDKYLTELKLIEKLEQRYFNDVG